MQRKAYFGEGKEKVASDRRLGKRWQVNGEENRKEVKGQNDK